MTLDEAIRHTEEEAKEQDKKCKRADDASGYTRSHNEEIRTSYAKQCEICAEEHRQLAEWLKDYKRLKEQEKYKVSVYDKDHIWYKGEQYISLRRFLEVKTEKKNEPCGDAISRQAALNCFTATKLKKFDFVLYAREEIKNLPPVTPQPKTGHWIVQDIHNCHTNFKCSECGYIHSFMHIYGKPTADYTYCPYCGARMVEPQESEVLDENSDCEVNNG